MRKPIALSLVSDPNLNQMLTQYLPEYDLHAGLDRADCVAAAADLRPSVALIDLDDADSGWRKIVIALQTNNATRRIPLIGLSDNPGQQAFELDAVTVVPKSGLSDQLAPIVARHARLWNEDYYAAMREACGEPLPPFAQEGIRLFNAQEYWEAHEALEHAWVEETRPVRDLYRAILQVGVAYYQIQKGNYRGAMKMFLRAVQWLDPLPDTCQGIDIAQLKQDAAAARAALQALSPENIAQFDKSYFRPVILIE